MSKEKEPKKITVAEAAARLKKAEKRVASGTKRLLEARADLTNADISLINAQAELATARANFREAAIDSAHDKFGIEKREKPRETFLGKPIVFADCDFFAPCR